MRAGFGLALSRARRTGLPFGGLAALNHAAPLRTRASALPRRDLRPLEDTSRPVTPVSRSMRRLVFRPRLSVIFFFRVGNSLSVQSQGSTRRFAPRPDHRSSFVTFP